MSANICFTDNELKALQKYLYRCKNDQHIGLNPDGCKALMKINGVLLIINKPDSEDLIQ
ncbi:hypothetical protein ELBI_90 [Anabaena phage Elbi]|nr:hypothetical protein ELBI_90 [Anabaena phage Elbi]